MNRFSQCTLSQAGLALLAVFAGSSAVSATLHVNAAAEGANNGQQAMDRRSTGDGVGEQRDVLADGDRQAIKLLIVWPDP